MNTLFPLDPVLPEGFRYYPSFISVEEEERLLKVIENIELHSFQFHGYTARRSVASFGFDWSFEHKVLKKGMPVPAAFDFLLQKVSDQTGIAAQEIAELLVTEYPEGAVINWHRDAPAFEIVMGISLLQDCHFRFREHKPATAKPRILDTLVERRSLYIMEGPARWEWQHAIAPVKKKRFSITLRTLKKQ